MKHLYFLSLGCIALFLSSKSYAQCTGGSSGGSIMPTSTWQNVSVTGGSYYSFSAIGGASYTFSFCQNGGNATFDTQITILDNSGNYVSGAYNDDACGTGSELVFVPKTTATYRILITEYNCLANATTAILAYKYQLTIPDDPCTATYINPSCATSYSIYSTYSSTNTSGVANPSCANYVGRDVWFKTVVPFSKSLVISTQAQDITDGALAVYSASSCAGPFTEISCNDDAIGYMPQISLSGLNPGDSIFIRFWTYNNAQVGSFGIYVNDPSPTYCMTGSARQNYTTGCIQMTPDQQGQNACIWNNTRLDLSQPFSYSFTMNFGTKDGTGADGITFVMQNSPAGMNALGSTGGDLGAVGISNSVIVEFDTYDNGTSVNDIADDHTAISLNGNLSSPVVSPVDASATSTNIEDGLNHTVRITWDPSTDLLSIYFDGSLRLTYTNDLVNNVFGGSSLAYWGFTSSTGLYSNTQTVCPGNLPGAPLPVTWESFKATAEKNSVVLNWQTEQEKNVSSFLIERSKDGINFNSIGKVDPSGSSNGDYQYEDFNPIMGLSYYRIKEVDLNSNYTNSETRQIDLKDKQNNFIIYPNPVSSSHEISVRNSASSIANFTVVIYDNMGKEIVKADLNAGKNSLKLPEDLGQGIYQVLIISEENIINKKLTVAE